MKLYTQLFISIFILFPYFIFTTEFYAEFNIILNKIFNKQLSQSVFKLIFSLYIILYFIFLILGFCDFIVFDILSGLITVCSSIIFYKPCTNEKKNYFEYYPHLEVIYFFAVGIYFIVHGIIIIINKIKTRKYFANLNANSINNINNINNIENIDISPLNLEKEKQKIIINNLSFEINQASLREIFFHFLTHKLYKLSHKKCYVTNFSKNDFNIDFEKKSIIISITYITLKYKKDSILLKNFRGKVHFVKNEVKIDIIEKGKISHEISTIKNVFLKGLYNLFKGIAVDKFEDKINKKIKKGFNFKREIFDINVLFQQFTIADNLLKFDFNLLVDIIN